MVNRQMLDLKKVSDFRIQDEADNFSDHLPILMSVALSISSASENATVDSGSKTLKWNKVSETDKLEY